MNPKRCQLSVSESCRSHDTSFGVRSFTKSELASQSNVRSCANQSGYKPINGTVCIVLRSHFLLCKALNPEGQIVGMTIFSCIPTTSIHPCKHFHACAKNSCAAHLYEFSARPRMTGHHVVCIVKGIDRNVPEDLCANNVFSKK